MSARLAGGRAIRSAAARAPVRRRERGADVDAANVEGSKRRRTFPQREVVLRDAVRVNIVAKGHEDRVDGHREGVKEGLRDRRGDAHGEHGGKDCRVECAVACWKSNSMLGGAS